LILTISSMVLGSSKTSISTKRYTASPLISILYVLHW
jgi:hypothetical protein